MSALVAQGCRHALDEESRAMTEQSGRPLLVDSSRRPLTGIGKSPTAVSEIPPSLCGGLWACPPIPVVLTPYERW